MYSNDLSSFLEIEEEDFFTSIHALNQKLEGLHIEIQGKLQKLAEATDLSANSQKSHLQNFLTEINKAKASIQSVINLT
ncbi:Uncharacterised protein (plasmid) [Legionella adelaidensis]|uniref:Uncharacterized protein n=1 Tax=Legionella adelaidensis TaxID=45056 RepID=A0A0W0R0F3_9GAMM|nr:hypothetical protein [Legionella adelaidensis]KTC64536.1 hypothetical protein Lade_1830 [Legionella adelaidensis]VEH85903.1 Uncharacterised protein [Legionella adelaidensis]